MEEKAYPTPFQKSVCWGALTALSLVLLISIAIALVYGAYAAFTAFKIVLLPFVIAGVLAYLLHPCVQMLQRQMEKRIKRKEGQKQPNCKRYAVILVMLMSLLAVGGLFMCVVPPLVKQTGQLIANREAILDNTAAATRHFLSENETAQYMVDTLYSITPFGDDDSHDSTAAAPEAEPDYPGKVLSIMKYYSGTITRVGTQWLFTGTRALYGALGYLFGIVMIPVSLYYFLLNSHEISNGWQKVLPLPPGRLRNEVEGTLKDINNYIIAFVRGQMLVSLIDGLILGVALTILGLPYAIPIAALAAILGIIPYLGSILTCIPALCIAWFYWHDVHYVLGVLAIFVAVSQFDGWVLQPKLLGRLVGMHDLTIMFSVLFWSCVLGGIVGALLAVPLTAALKVLLVRYAGAKFEQNKEPQEQSS